MITFNLKMINGVPIRHANYILYHNNQITDKKGVTDSNGNALIIAGVSEGKVSVKIEFPNYTYFTQDFDFVDGSTYEDDKCPLLLCDAGVKFIVNDAPTGNCDAEVYNSDTNEKITSFRFDSNGWHQLSNLIYQKIYFKIFYIGEWRKSKDFILAPFANPYLVVSEFWTGGIEEAPIDNKEYTRKNATWVESTGGIEEAPDDGQQYARKNKDWAVVVGGGDVEEAPDDGKAYSRKNKDWEETQALWG